MKFVDTHCHLYAEEFAKDSMEELEKALDANVDTIVLPAIDSETHAQLFELAAKSRAFLPLIGLHPTSVNGSFRHELDIVERYIGSHMVYGIGEVGIDLYWSKEFKQQQEEAFAAQIELSLKHNLPLVIHSREAFKEIFNVLRAFKGQPVRGIFHAFTGTLDDYNEICTLGDFMVGIGGIVTFKNSGLAEVVASIPMERIVLETDAPYLAPTPLRGTRNTPSNIPLIAAKIAQVKNITLEMVAEQTTNNAAKVFKI